MFTKEESELLQAHLLRLVTKAKIKRMRGKPLTRFEQEVLALLEAAEKKK